MTIFIYLLAILLGLIALGWVSNNKAKVREFLRLWPEAWSLPLTLVLWIASPVALHWIDPTAATYDAGVLQVYLHAAFGLLVANALVWLGIKLNFFGFFSYYKSTDETGFKNEFKTQLTPVQRCVSLLSIYSVLLLCFALLARIV